MAQRFMYNSEKKKSASLEIKITYVVIVVFFQMEKIAISCNCDKLASNSHNKIPGQVLMKAQSSMHTDS